MGHFRDKYIKFQSYIFYKHAVVPLLNENM